MCHRKVLDLYFLALLLVLCFVTSGGKICAQDRKALHLDLVVNKGKTPN